MLEITTLVKVEHYEEKILFTEEALQAYKDEYFKWNKEYPTFASITTKKRFINDKNIKTRNLLKEN